MMDAEHIGEMTKEELEAFIIQVINQRFPKYPYVQKGDRPMVEVLESMNRNRIKRNPGDPSVLELLREDRDR